MRLTIAQFTFGLQLAGQERVVVDLAKAFHEKGHRSLVCTTLFRGELAEELESYGIPFKCLDLKKSYDPRALLPVIYYLKDNKVDAVITHGNSGCLIPRISAILSKIPAFIHVEHNVSDYKKIYHIIINKILTKFTDNIVCVSECAKHSLLKVEKTDPDKVVVIPNGLNIDRFSFIEKKPEKNRTKKVGIVARFYEQKGHIYFVEAATKVVKAYNNVEFIFVGDGYLKPIIEQIAREYGIEKYCNFLGVRYDVAELLQTFDIFVLSSLWEGLPISLLEAQYLGVASVVTNVGGVPEVIQDGHNGLLVPPKDSNALASAIIKVLTNDNLRNDLSQNGQNVFAKKFTVEKMANAYLNLIDANLHF